MEISSVSLGPVPSPCFPSYRIVPCQLLYNLKWKSACLLSGKVIISNSKLNTGKQMFPFKFNFTHSISPSPTVLEYSLRNDTFRQSSSYMLKAAPRNESTMADYVCVYNVQNNHHLKDLLTIVWCNKPFPAQIRPEREISLCRAHICNIVYNIHVYTADNQTQVPALNCNDY